MVTEDEKGVRITLADVHRDLQEMKQLLTRLSLSLPAAEERAVEFESRTRRELDDHEDRIRRVESRVWQAIGGFGLLAALAPIVSKLIGI